MPRRVKLVAPALSHEVDFLRAVRRSRDLHRGWVKPPGTRERFRAWVERARLPNYIPHLVVTPEGAVVGAANLSEIVRGAFRSAYLGYYAFVPHAGKGLLREGLSLVLRAAFTRYRLHRVEANVQPGNVRSRALVLGLGFRLEGFSPRYLKIAGHWRDHERFAMTVEDWSGPC